jgi:hypothetical protein
MLLKGATEVQGRSVGIGAQELINSEQCRPSICAFRWRLGIAGRAGHNPANLDGYSALADSASRAWPFDDPCPGNSTEHLPKKEFNVLPINAVLLALSVFVALGRWPLFS